MFERKYSSERVVAKLAWIKVLVGEIRIGPGVGQRFGSPSVKAHSWQKGILVTDDLESSEVMGPSKIVSQVKSP